jgi:hypothetical protein
MNLCIICEIEIEDEQQTCAFCDAEMASMELEILEAERRH